MNLDKVEKRRFWTSDLHFGHVNIRDYCPGRLELGPDVPSMNEALIRNWNETVAPEDDVMIVGDLCMGKLDESLTLIPRLNGNKRLVPGNHDRCWEFAKNKTPEKAAEMKQKYKDVGLEVWPGQVTLQLGPYTVLVCHFPYRGDSHDEDRYKFARPFDEGRILVCGHVHDSWTISERQINVGVDVHSYRPISETLLINLIEEVESGSHTGEGS